MRVRDLMIVHASQRFKKRYYFLTWGIGSYQDPDSWIGIYIDLAKLRKDYNHMLGYGREKLRWKNYGYMNLMKISRDL